MPGRYSWNLNNNVSRRLYNPNPPPQIACRICNHVFVSTQALIDHIETHMKDDYYSSSSSRTRQPPLAGGGRGSLINLMNTQRNNCPLTIFPSMSSPSSTLPVFNPNNITLPSFQERNPTFNPVPPPRMAPLRRFSPYLGLRNNNNYYTVGLQQFLFPLLQAAPKKAIGEETNSDCTKPYLQMLDKPFLYTSADKSNKSDLGLLDLILKL